MIRFGFPLKNYLALSLLMACSLPTLADVEEVPSDRGLERGKGKVKVSYDVRSLHLDGQKSIDDDAEVDWALKKSNRISKSGPNSGFRDQFVAGVSHLYANAINQRLSKCYYVQGVQTSFIKVPKGVTKSSGEQARLNSFDGLELGDSPLVAATLDGIAFLEESFTGQPNLAAGSNVIKKWGRRNFRINEVESGADLDSAWEANGGKPMICAVNAEARMFDDDGEEKPGLGGHVIVISERRNADPNLTKSSKYEYMLLNSWGQDENGAARNGWVGGDQLVSSMNYLGVSIEDDQSLPPSRRGRRNSDYLPAPSRNRFAISGKGLTMTASKFDLDHSTGITDASPSRNVRGTKDPSKEADELRKNISNKEEGFSAEDIATAEKAIDGILSNKTYSGKERPYPLSDKEKATVLSEANRLFDQSDKIYKQGLDKGDRNRALVAMLHDTANPDHINQGLHNTCNVTTIMKIESMLRPGAQARRFVDMYINANGDQTVSMER